MYLLPAFSWISRTAARIFYRLEIEGSAPPEGPLLLVANHPNALLDPALVVAAARRPVRFLSKAPLLRDRRVGWLVRAVGSIPVVRKMDDPDATAESNQASFAAAHQALAEGAAIALFPEGTSHSDPQLKPLKTGAARIALGAAARAPALRIVPVGLVFRGPAGKSTFRAEALVLLGDPVEWSDLAGVGTEPEAVRELTRRIDAGLRRVTINAEHWEDLPLLETGEAVWRAHQGSADARPLQDGGEPATERPAGSLSRGRTARDTEPARWKERHRVRRLGTAARLLERLRQAERGSEDDDCSARAPGAGQRVGGAGAPPSAESAGPLRPDGGDGEPLLVALEAHHRCLATLRLDPRDIASDPDLRTAVRWSARRIHLLALPALLVAALGWLAFWPPFRLTGWITGRLNVTLDQVSTHKLLIGTVVYGVWLTVLSGAAAIAPARAHPVSGVAAFVLTFVALVLCGLGGLAVRERWRASARDLRGFLVLRTDRGLADELRAAQQELAERIDALVRGERARHAETS